MHALRVVTGGFILLAVPIFRVVFAVPAAAALLLVWRLSRG